MKIHEYQAKELLAAAGAAVPRGVIANSPAEAERAFDQLGGPVVLKAQVHAGGRGKGGFKGSGLPSGEEGGLGGVKFIKKREDVAKFADIMFKYPLATHQSGPEGQKVSKVLVVQASANIMTDPNDPEGKRKREVYVGVVLDRALGLPILMGCSEGGVEIE